MVPRAPRSWKHWFWATELLSSTLFEGFHGLIIPNLVSKVGIRNRKLRWKVGYDVCIMNNSVSLRNALSNIAGKGLVSNSRLAECVKLINVSENVVQIQSSDSSQSRSQTISGHKDLSVSVKWKQFLNLSSNVALNSSEGIIETLVDLASRASWVRHLNINQRTWVASRSTIQFWMLTVLLKVITMAWSSGENPVYPKMFRIELLNALV